MNPSLDLPPPADAPVSPSCRRLLSAVTDAVLVTDGTGRALWMNAVAQRYVERYGHRDAGDRLESLPFSAEGRETLRRAIGEMAAASAAGTTEASTEVFPALERDRRPLPVRVMALEDGVVALLWRRRGGDAQWLPHESMPLLLEQVIVLEETGGADDGLRIVFVNEAFERQTGYAPHEVLGQPPAILDGPATDYSARARLREALAAGEHARAELVQYRQDGSAYWAEIEVVPRHDEAGRRTHWVAVQRDISARKRLEEQLFQSQKMEAVGRLAGGVAHDFNNVLTAIGGFSELLLEELPESMPAREEVRQIRAAAERATSLTRQLLAFSRRQILRPRATRLPALVSGMERLLQRAVGERVRLHLALPDVSSPVLADPTQLEQVVLNLLVNAAEAMPDGGTATIEVSEVALDASYSLRHHELQPGHYVCLAVSDTGTGMDRETRERVFEPFFTTKEGGTGLGLSTVYGIVRQSGGHVWVYSEPGSGSTFKVYLPVTTRADDETGAAEHPDRDLTGSETVLVVEDEALVREVASAMLRRRGYTVLTAGDGEEALRVAAQHPGRIDLLLSDVVMPRANGQRVAELLRVQRPEVRVLFMSGYTEDAIVHHGVLAPGVELLEKPFTDLALAARVRATLDAGR